MADNKENRAGLWWLIGCGGLALVSGACCIVPGILTPLFSRFAGSPVGTEWLESEGLSDAGPGPRMPAPPRPLSQAAGRPRSVGFTVDSITGEVGVNPNARCLLTLTPGDDGCQATVVCDTTELYGGYSPAFLSCETEPHLVARDEEPTGVDGDPVLRLHTGDGTVELSDGALGPHGAFVLKGSIVEVL